MTLNIKDPETDRIVRDLAQATGESITVAVAVAARERLERVRGRSSGERRYDDLLRIARRSAARSTLDERSPDEILGYDADGVPS